MHLVLVKRNFRVRLLAIVVRQSSMIYVYRAYKTPGHANTCDQLSLFGFQTEIFVVLRRFSKQTDERDE